MAQTAPLLPGDPAPWFRHRCTTPSGSYSFDMAAGRHVLLYFFASATEAATKAALAAIGRRRALFDDRDAMFFGISADPSDEQQSRLQADLPGIRFFFDDEGAIALAFGLRPGVDGAWFLLDPLLRVRGVLRDQQGACDQVLDVLAEILESAETAPEGFAPALDLPGVFEPEFCDRLIAHYHAEGAVPSGFFTQDAGASVSHAVTDASFKQRHDCVLRDRTLVEQVQARVIRRIVPEIRKSFQFEATRLDRLIVACYQAEDGGRFGPHRDNTVSAAAHRRFAVSINLNDTFEGGELVFPEFGRRRYRPGRGGALVFSCSLLHAVMPVTAGRRYACLPFLHDEAAAAIKRAHADARPR